VYLFKRYSLFYETIIYLISKECPFIEDLVLWKFENSIQILVAKLYLVVIFYEIKVYFTRLLVKL
jgi:hypothetical protein